MLEPTLTAGEALGAVRDRWPSARTDTEILNLLRACENTVRTEVLGLDGLAEPLAPETVLAVPSPYDGLYAHYAAALLAQMDGETTRYNEELALFYARWSDFTAACRRETLPDDRCAAGYANRGVKR